MFRPDITEMVNWALKPNYLYLHTDMNQQSDINYKYTSVNSSIEKCFFFDACEHTKMVAENLQKESHLALKAKIATMTWKSRSLTQAAEAVSSPSRLTSIAARQWLTNIKETLEKIVSCK